jgi:cytochrome c oxidase cbb3-type subunit 3
MYRRLCVFVALCLCVSGLIVVGQQSPAAQRPPQTVTPQSYPPELVLTGQTRFASECGFCHGRDAAGGETGPDLTRSILVAEDSRGDKIRAVVRSGRVDKGMPSFEMEDAELEAIVAFIHDQKTKAESLGGGRRSVDVSDLETGNVDAGRRYFNGAGGCSNCHSPSGDLADIGSRFRGLPLLERMLYPRSVRPETASPKVTVTTSSGETITGSLVSRDEFTITVGDSTGSNRTWPALDVKFTIYDGMNAHFEQLGKYTDQDMHNVYAYLQTLRQ